MRKLEGTVSYRQPTKWRGTHGIRWHMTVFKLGQNAIELTTNYPPEIEDNDEIIVAGKIKHKPTEARLGLMIAYAYYNRTKDVFGRDHILLEYFVGLVLIFIGLALIFIGVPLVFILVGIIFILIGLIATLTGIYCFYSGFRNYRALRLIRTLAK